MKQEPGYEAARSIQGSWPTEDELGWARDRMAEAKQRGFGYATWSVRAYADLSQPKILTVIAWKGPGDELQTAGTA